MTGKELNGYRNGHDWTQSELASLLSVTVTTLARWERGEASIPPYLPLALKGLAFTHGTLCPCQACYARYGERPGRDPRQQRGA